MRKSLIFLMLTLAAATLFMVTLSGCENSPQAPTFDNIFDPEADGGGDPFQLNAAMLDSFKVVLTWTIPQGFDIEFVDVSHSFSPTSGFLSLGTVATPAKTFTYRDAEPTRTHYFRLKGYNASGDFTNLSTTTNLSFATPPRVTINDGGTQVGSRNITLNITVSQGDSLRIWTVEDPDGEMVTAAPIPGETGNIPFTLPGATSNDTTFDLRVQAFPLDSPGEVFEATLDVNFRPVFHSLEDSTAVGSRDVELDIPDQGLLFIRFADTPEALADQTWLRYSPSHTYRISEAVERQVIWGEFMSDFGFSMIASLGVTPSTLADASFALDLETAHQAESAVVTILNQAAATRMRFSESPDFTDLPWQPYSEELDFALSPGAGFKTIYGQFRNDWAESAILSDFVVYLAQDLEISFLAPLDGNTVTGGTTLQVQGSARSATEISGVHFDSGDGNGFQPAEGTETWTALWEVPTVSEETQVVLRARVYADGEYATATCTVTIPAEVVPD